MNRFEKTSRPGPSPARPSGRGVVKILSRQILSEPGRSKPAPIQINRLRRSQKIQQPEKRRETFAATGGPPSAAIRAISGRRSIQAASAAGKNLIFEGRKRPIYRFSPDRVRRTVLLSQLQSCFPKRGFRQGFLQSSSWCHKQKNVSRQNFKIINSVGYYDS